MGKIIWLASYPKSGNTWVRAFLHNLLRNPDSAYDINKITDFTTSDSSIEWYKMHDRRPWPEWSADEVAALRRKAQLSICASRREDIFVKTHNAMMTFRGHPLIHTDLMAGAIYVVRNPLDVVISLKHHYGCDLDTAIDVLADPSIGSTTNDKIVYEVHKNWSIHVDSWTSSPWPGLHVVRYEDMLSAPIRAFRAFPGFWD